MNELTITPIEIHEYCKKHSSPISDQLIDLVSSTQKFAPHVSHMQVGHLEGNFLAILLRLMNAERVLEFGTFTGYSTLAMAEALPSTGQVITLDRDPKSTALAQEHWNKSSHGSKIKLVLGDARQSCQKLLDEIRSNKMAPFDLAFIDADKAGYEHYYESSLEMLKKGGAIVVDNVLWSGAVLNPQDASDRTIHSFNQKISGDDRVQKVVLPIRDGITLMVKL